MERGGVTTMNKAEIDTSAPFQSVKEAVMLFGERVLAEAVYANKLKEKGANENGRGAVTVELEKTKQSLEKAREESMNMARCLSSLQQELEETKRELQKLKTRDFSDSRVLDIETEDLKFIEDSTTSIEQVKEETAHSRDQKVEVQRKKYVTFGSCPSVVHRVIVPPPSPTDEAVLTRHPSLKKKKKKPLILFFGGIFSKKRGNSEVAMA